MEDEEDSKDGIIVHPDDPVPWFPGQEEDQSVELDPLNKPARLKRRRRCGQCGPCQIQSNCGECSYCVRRSVLKQSCIYRKCIYLRKPVHGTAKTPPRRPRTHKSNPKGTQDLSSSYEEELDSSYELMSPTGMEISGYHIGAMPSDDTEILIEDYNPSPSIIIGAMEDDPSDLQPPSPTQTLNHSFNNNEHNSSPTNSTEDIQYSRVVRTPPHPMDCEDDDSFVNPRKVNSLKAAKEKALNIVSGSLKVVTSVSDLALSSNHENGNPNTSDGITIPVSVISDSQSPYPVNIVRNITSSSSDNTEERSNSLIQNQTISLNEGSNLAHQEGVTTQSSDNQTIQKQKANSNCSALLQQLAHKVPSEHTPDSDVNHNVQTVTKPKRHVIPAVPNPNEDNPELCSVVTSSLNPAVNNHSHISVPVVKPQSTSSSSENHSQNSHKQSKGQSISSTFHDSYRQFFSPPNVTVTDLGGFTTPANQRDIDSLSKNHRPQGIHQNRTDTVEERLGNSREVPHGSQTYRTPLVHPALSSQDPAKTPFPPTHHPSWYPNIPYVYPHMGMPRGMYPPNYPAPRFDAVGYMTHPQNPFIRLEGYPGPPGHPMMHPAMVHPGFFPYPRYPGEHPYAPPGIEDFSRHPDFRKRSNSMTVPNLTKYQHQDLSSREEIDQYKKYSVFRLRAEDKKEAEKSMSPVTSKENERQTDIIQSRISKDSVPASNVHENSTSSQCSLQTSIPSSNNDTLRTLLNISNVPTSDDNPRSRIDDDLCKEMNKHAGHNSCSVVDMDDFRMQTLNRGEVASNAASDSSSPNSSSSGSPQLSDKSTKDSSHKSSDSTLKSVPIEGSILIKQDLGDEGVVMVEFDCSKVELVECVLNDEILKMSDNPKELKEYIEKSQLKGSMDHLDQSNVRSSLVSPKVCPPLKPMPGLTKGIPSPSPDLTEKNTCDTSSNEKVPVSPISREAPENEKLDSVPCVTGATSNISSTSELPQIESVTSLSMPSVLLQHLEAPSKPIQESWKQSYMKIFSGTNNSKGIKSMEESHSNQVVNAISSLRELCTENLSANAEKQVAPKNPHHSSNHCTNQNSLHQLLDKNVNHKISYKNSEIHQSNKTQSSILHSKVMDLGSDCHTTKKRAMESEIESNFPVISQKRKRTEKFVNQNLNPSSPSQSTTIVKNLSNFVQNTIETYSHIKEGPQLVEQPESDTTLLCEEYKKGSEESDKIYLTSEKTLADLKSKYFSEFPDNFKITSSTDSFFSDSLKSPTEGVENLESQETETSIVKSCADVEDPTNESTDKTPEKCSSGELKNQPISSADLDNNRSNESIAATKSADSEAQNNEISNQENNNGISCIKITNVCNVSEAQYLDVMCSQNSKAPPLIDNPV